MINNALRCLLTIFVMLFFNSKLTYKTVCTQTISYNAVSTKQINPG